eukprot:g4446.t1
MACQPNVIREVVASFKPPKEGDSDYSALAISFAKTFGLPLLDRVRKCRSNAFSDARILEDQAEYEAFRVKYPFDEDTHNYLQTSQPDVRRYVMRNFKPPREGEADYSALLITYCKSCRANVNKWGKGGVPPQNFGAWGKGGMGGFPGDTVARVCGGNGRDHSAPGRSRRGLEVVTWL